MSGRHPISQMNELSDRFRELGEAAAAAEHPSGLRAWIGRHRRVTIGSAVAVGLAATSAAATQFISTGDPVREQERAAPQYRPGTREPQVVATAPDAVLGQPWGVAVYDTAAGQQCVLAGQLRGERLGIARDGTFHPYATGTSGACGRLERGELFWSLRRFDTDPRRVVIFGRAGRGVTSVRLSIGASRRTGRVAAGGAFLFVLDSSPDLRNTGLEPLGADGGPAAQ